RARSTFPHPSRRLRDRAALALRPSFRASSHGEMATARPQGRRRSGRKGRIFDMTSLSTWFKSGSIALAFGLALVQVPAKADDIKIAVVTHGQSSDSYWGVVKKGVDDATKLMGVNVTYQAPQTTDMVAEARMIDAAVTQKVQGLVVSIPD